MHRWSRSKPNTWDAFASIFTPVHWGHPLGVGHRLSYVQSPRDSAMYSQTRHSDTLDASSPVLQAWTMLLEYLFVSEDVERRTSNLNCNPPEEQPANYEQASSQAELDRNMFFFVSSGDFGHCVELVSVYAGVIRLILGGIVQCGRELYPCKPESFTKALWEIT